MLDLIRKMLSLFLLLVLVASPSTALPATSSPAPLPPASQPPTQTPAPEAAPSPALPNIIMAAQPPAPTQNDFRPADGPPDYDALIPADPDAAPRPTADLAEYGLTQITYWSCATIAAATQCGWHRPLVPVSAAPPPRELRVGAVIAMACGTAAALLLL